MRQGGSHGLQPEDRGRPHEHAEFEAARVGGPGRTRAPIIAALGFVVVLGAIVAAGVGGRSPSGAVSVIAGGAQPSAGVAPSLVAPTPGRASPTHPAATFVPAAPLLTSGPGPIQLVAQRSSEGMFVHGDVFVARVTWVYVSLYDDAGNVAGWASVSVPGAAGPGRSAGPTLRFDVELALPAAFDGRLWISANAYDDVGTLIAGARIEADAALRPPAQPTS
jgi:hypothetical protein